MHGEIEAHQKALIKEEGLPGGFTSSGLFLVIIMTIIRERQQCPALREDSTSEHHTLPKKKKKNTNEFGAQPGLNELQLLAVLQKKKKEKVPKYNSPELLYQMASLAE